MTSSLPPARLAEDATQARATTLGAGALATAFPAIARAASTGLLDALDERPRPAADLARASPDDPRLVRRMLDVLVALGLARREGAEYAAAPGLLAMTRGPMRSMLLDATRSQARQLADLLARIASPAPLRAGWAYEDPEILEAQGAASASIALALRSLLPEMDDLGERLERPGAAFLDVGTGVAGLALAFARQFPHARVVGLDVADAPLALARRNVQASGLGARVEVRKQGVETLDERDAYDLAWLPAVFLPPDVLDAALPRVLRALRPGGWILVPATPVGDDGLLGAAGAFSVVLMGGEPRDADALARMLAAAGFTDARDAGGFVVARRGA